MMLLENIYSESKEINKNPLKISRGDINYRPDFWNLNMSIKLSTNCYAYALNLARNPTSNRFFPKFGNKETQVPGLIPGGLSGSKLSRKEISPERIVELCKKDADAYGGIFIETSKDSLCPLNTWKVALFLSARKIKQEGSIQGYWDFHFLRENPDYTWSHKLGIGKVTNLDANEKLIKDPEHANLNYSENTIMPYNYSVFVGYFLVGPGGKNCSKLQGRIL